MEGICRRHESPSVPASSLALSLVVLAGLILASSVAAQSDCRRWRDHRLVCPRRRSPAPACTTPNLNTAQIARNPAQQGEFHFGASPSLDQRIITATGTLTKEVDLLNLRVTVDASNLYLFPECQSRHSASTASNAVRIPGRHRRRHRQPHRAGRWRRDFARSARRWPRHGATWSRHTSRAARWAATTRSAPRRRAVYSAPETFVHRHRRRQEDRHRCDGAAHPEPAGSAGRERQAPALQRRGHVQLTVPRHCPPTACQTAA